jgi:hypothetical protein
MSKQKKKVSRKKQFINYLGTVATGIFSAVLVLGTSPASAIDPANEVVGSESGKQVLNGALKVARSKPALSVAMGITCIACMPVAGATASTGMCLSCG